MTFSGCWFQIFLFSPRTLGRWSNFDEHIFQMGWFNFRSHFGSIQHNVLDIYATGFGAGLSWLRIRVWEDQKDGLLSCSMLVKICLSRCICTVKLANWLTCRASDDLPGTRSIRGTTALVAGTFSELVLEHLTNLQPSGVIAGRLASAEAAGGYETEYCLAAGRGRQTRGAEAGSEDGRIEPEHNSDGRWSSFCRRIGQVSAQVNSSIRWSWRDSTSRILALSRHLMDCKSDQFLHRPTTPISRNLIGWVGMPSDLAHYSAIMVLPWFPYLQWLVFKGNLL